MGARLLNPRPPSRPCLKRLGISRRVLTTAGGARSEPGHALFIFGFSIYKFFQIEVERAIPKSGRLLGPREFAIMMMAIGLTSLFMATIEHRRGLHILKTDYPHVKIRRSIARFIAGVI